MALCASSLLLPVLGLHVPETWFQHTDALVLLQSSAVVNEPPLDKKAKAHELTEFCYEDHFGGLLSTAHPEKVKESLAKATSPCSSLETQLSQGHFTQDQFGNLLTMTHSEKDDPHADDESVAKDWWDNRASKSFQHLDKDYVASHAGEWDAFLPHFQWTGKAVLDYGIGAGYLGERLLKPPYSIGAYIGVDISQKALDAAKDILKPWSQNVHFHLTPQKFAELRPSIFVSQQVIQHFPSIKYLEDFLANVDASGAQELMLHFRASDSNRTSANDAYRTSGTTHNVGFALLTTASFLQTHLPHYVLNWSDTRPMCCGTNGQYTGWTRKV